MSTGYTVAMKTVAVIFGGRSTEHDVSIVTALASVIKPLELTREYRVEAVYIDRTGRWFWDEKLKDISLFTSGKIDDFLRTNKPVDLRFSGGLVLVKSGKLAGGKTCHIDVAFPAMHGTYGEDGALMGLLEMAGVAYVGCNVPASAIAMDKLLAKKLAEVSGVATPKYVSFSKAEWQKDADNLQKRISKELRLPLFVKPTHLGSSIGITRVADIENLADAIDVAAHYDTQVIVEEGVQNLVEVTLPIIGPTDAPEPALLEQPQTTAEDFFDFDTKYMQGGKKGKNQTEGEQGAQGYSKIPADLPKDLYDAAEATGLAVYKAVGCSGIARIDMLVDTKAKQVYFNEINPLPGSLYAHNWKQKGVSGISLVTKLIGYAEARATAERQQETAFSTNYLKQF